MSNQRAALLQTMFAVCLAARRVSVADRFGANGQELADSWRALHDAIEKLDKCLSSDEYEEALHALRSEAQDA